MPKRVTNFDQLAKTPARTDALTIVEAGLAAIDTTTALRAQVLVANNILTVGGKSYELDAYEYIYIIGFGKVSCTAARTLEQIFDGKVRGGAVVGITQQVCEVVDTYAGTHPIPSSLNYTATKHIEDIAHQATERDLVLVVVSGGGSALLCSSMGECEQGARLFSSFLPSGGTIEELNIVRKHISHLKGGGLAAALHPATVIGLIFSDVPGGDLSAVASGPTYFDTTTSAQAAAVIDRYNLGTFRLNETPKDETIFDRVHNVPLVTNETALTAMAQAATAAGYDARVLSSTAYHTPAETAALLRANAAPNTVLLLGGETKLSVPSDCIGQGGRNDFMALRMLDELAEDEVFVSLASDGKDNTEAAGAIVDARTKVAAAAAGVTVADHLACLNSFPFFDATSDHLLTGPLESNVADLQILLIPPVPVADLPPITAISGVQVKDSRGRATIAVTVTAGAHSGTFSVPSGASTGEREVQALPAKAALLMLTQTVAPALIGRDVTDQAALDGALHALDGSPQFSVIGGNVALGVSVAALKAAAAVRERAVHEQVAEVFGYRSQAVSPRLFVNLINGGAHATVGSAIQEHQIIPETDNVAEALRVAEAVQRALRDVLRERYPAKKITTGDEGGFVIPSHNLFEAFEYVTAAIARAGCSVPVSLGSDIAASSFATEAGYALLDQTLSSTQLLDWYVTLHERFPTLNYVEDPADENDLATFAAYQAAHPAVTTIGDDLTTTNVATLQAAITAGAITGIIIKPNQIGTVSDTLATMALAYQHNVRCIVSHRSGETMDDFIADLAWGTKCFGLKAGAPNAKERRVKYDRLVTIAKD